MEENKQAICKALVPVLQMTRGLYALVDLEYTEKDGDEYVIVTYNNSYKKLINVTADSGTAMIQDICKWAV